MLERTTVEAGTVDAPMDELLVERRSGLRDLVQNLREHHFVLVEPGGNYGDYLIYLGAEALFRACGVSWESVGRDEFMTRRAAKHEVAYLHGSGGFNPWCSGWALRIVKFAIDAGYRMVVQGPQTTAVDREYIRSQLVPGIANTGPSEVVFFARELTTLEALSEYWPREATLLVDDDTALHTPLDALERFGGRRERYDLFGIRTDPERTDTVLRRPAGATGAIELDPPYFARSFAHWVRLHSSADGIVTNRTHSAVVGALLGKDVTMLAGSYHKNRSIWEYSLRSRGVRWADSLNQVPVGLRQRTSTSRLSRWDFMARLALRGVPLR